MQGDGAVTVAWAQPLSTHTLLYARGRGYHSSRGLNPRVNSHYHTLLYKRGRGCHSSRVLNPCQLPHMYAMVRGCHRAVTKGLNTRIISQLLNLVVKFGYLCCLLLIAFSEAKAEQQQEGTYDTTANDNNPYGKMSSSDGYYDGLDEIYDDIDEPSDCYTSLNLVEPKEDEHDYTKIKRKEEEEEEDFPAEAPEPPPMREHMYLELVNLP